MKSALYQYGQKVKVKWHEAECGISNCIVVGIRMSSENKPPDYIVKELNEFGNMMEGMIDVDEDMMFL